MLIRCQSFFNRHLFTSKLKSPIGGLSFFSIKSTQILINLINVLVLKWYLYASFSEKAPCFVSKNTHRFLLRSVRKKSVWEIQHLWQYQPGKYFQYFYITTLWHSQITLKCSLPILAPPGYPGYIPWQESVTIKINCFQLWIFNYK